MEYFAATEPTNLYAQLVALDWRQAGAVLYTLVPPASLAAEDNKILGGKPAGLS